MRNSHTALGVVLVVVLTYDGNDVQAAGGLTEWFVRIDVTRNFTDFAMLTGFYAEEPPRSVAYWQGGLCYGTNTGQVRRTIGE